MENKDWVVRRYSRYVYTGDVRVKKRFTLFGITATAQTFEINGKWKWFGLVEVRERKRLVQYSYFDDGWSYQNYWGKTKEEWEFLEFI